MWRSVSFGFDRNNIWNAAIMGGVIFKQRQLKGQNFQDICVSVVQSGDLQALKNLLSGQGGIDVNTSIGRLGLTFLHLSAIFGEIKLARWLLDNKAKANKKEGYSGKTSAHIAAYYGDIEVLILLTHYREN